MTSPANIYRSFDDNHSIGSSATPIVELYPKEELNLENDNENQQNENQQNENEKIKIEKNEAIEAQHFNSIKEIQASAAITSAQTRGDDANFNEHLDSKNNIKISNSSKVGLKNKTRSNSDICREYGYLMDENGILTRSLLYSMEDQQDTRDIDRNIEVLRETPPTATDIPSCSEKCCCCLPRALRRNKLLLISIFLITFLGSALLAIILSCESVNIEILSKERLTYDYDKHTINGTITYKIYNPNFLSISLETISLKVFYYNFNEGNWRQFDDELPLDQETFNINARSTNYFDQVFTYSMRSSYVNTLIAKQCGLFERGYGNLRLAFSGVSFLKYFYRKIKQDWGPITVQSECEPIEYDNIHNGEAFNT